MIFNEEVVESQVENRDFSLSHLRLMPSLGRGLTVGFTIYIW